jgi:UDP-2,3-diacylglucosamine pyrophosphatase LpxH
MVAGSFCSDWPLRRDGGPGMWDTGLGGMRIAVISDLHIGADEFSPTGFGDFLDHLEREHDEIILLGDVFECYFPALPWRALAQYDGLDRLHRDITHRFRSAKYTMLSGNHDMVVRRARGIPSKTERAHNGYRILLSHGHENESAFGSTVKVRLVELYMWLVYRLKRVGLPALYHYSYRMDYERNMKDGGAAHLEAARHLVRRGYDVVVFGHTHVPRHVELREGGTYINTGDCVRRRMYASLDLERRECQLFQFPGRRVATEREDDGHS